jgi:hypothetical protein
MKTLRHTLTKAKEQTIMEEDGRNVHPVIEQVSRAISDWHSERDWFFQTDRAMRVIDAIACELNKEGHKSASSYLRRVLDDNEPKGKSPDLVDVKGKENFSRLYF